MFVCVCVCMYVCVCVCVCTLTLERSCQTRWGRVAEGGVGRVGLGMQQFIFVIFGLRIKPLREVLGGVFVKPDSYPQMSVP